MCIYNLLSSLTPSTKNGTLIHLQAEVLKVSNCTFHHCDRRFPNSGRVVFEHAKKDKMKKRTGICGQSVFDQQQKKKKREKKEKMLTYFQNLPSFPKPSSNA